MKRVMDDGNVEVPNDDHDAEQPQHCAWESILPSGLFAFAPGNLERGGVGLQVGVVHS